MNSPHRTRRAAALLASLCGALALRGSSTAADVESPRPPAKPIEFNRDVRPILAGRCFVCHGPDKGARKADLRLDQRDGLFGSREGGAPVVPRDPSRSQLFLRVTSLDPAERMPPPETGKTLSPKDIATLERWIAEGATWQGHWAYLELRRPELPADGPAGAAPIDRFILAKLREVGLEPSPEADARTLVRRLSIDITGLPPEPARVEEYVRSPSSESYERLVDEFLASPQYGERMAAAWLDLVRYADSVGFHGDQPQTVWPFRDYVIRAFNENLPFDRFTQEQIAGDLIPNATLEQKIAAAYNRLNMMSAEGGGQDKEYIAKYASDRVRATSIAWLGATLGCAECHDHKFDPFTSRDFYSFAAFFADVSERGIYGGAESSGAWGEMLAVPSPQQAEALRRLDDDIIAAKAELAAETPERKAARDAWEADLRRVAWTVLTPLSASSAGGATLAVQSDGSILASGQNPARDTYTLTARLPARGVTAFRLETIPDASLPKKGSGRSPDGNFVLSEMEVSVAPEGGAATRIRLAAASASFEQKAAAEKTRKGKWSIESSIDGDAEGADVGWAILEEAQKPQQAYLEVGDKILPAEPAAAGGVLPPEQLLTFTLRQQHSNPGYNLGRFRISTTDAALPIPRAGPVLPPAVEAALAVEPARRSDTQVTEIAQHYRDVAPMLEAERARVRELEAARVALDKKVPRMLATVATQPRTIRILPRGNWMDDTGPEVSPAVPAFLPQPDLRGRRATRLDLARWLTSPENPLTARVLVNRIWRLFFGAGLSRRLDDLGSQGDWPSHPELLDWLASELRDGGWDVKRLIKSIVMSRAYRQTSLASAELREKDPYNRWIARQARFRFDAEVVHDNALAVSGLLVREIGGPSVKPYQPPGYWAYLNFPTREWQNDTGTSQYRRALYTHWQRQYLHPALMAFDAPSREECTAERPRSNTPLQALVLLNDPTQVEAARAFAERIAALKIEGTGGDQDVARIDAAFRRALSRPALPSELRILVDLYRKHLAAYRADPEAARELLKVGQRVSPAEADPAELAAWTSVARAVLNLHETITRS